MGEAVLMVGVDLESGIDESGWGVLEGSVREGIVEAGPMR